MRSGRKVVALTGLLGVVAGCGAGSLGGSAPSAGSAVTSAARPAPDGPPLVGTEWELAAVLRDGSELRRPPAAREALLRLDGKGKITGIDGCNAFGGDVRVGPATLTIGQLMTNPNGLRRGQGPRGLQRDPGRHRVLVDPGRQAAAHPAGRGGAGVRGEGLDLPGRRPHAAAAGPP